MALPKPKLGTTQVAKVRKVRGVPITELSRDKLIVELERALDSKASLEQTIRLHHMMWREAMAQGGLPDEALTGIARRVH